MNFKKMFELHNYAKKTFVGLPISKN